MDSQLLTIQVTQPYLIPTLIWYHRLFIRFDYGACVDLQILVPMLTTVGLLGLGVHGM